MRITEFIDHAYRPGGDTPPFLSVSLDIRRNLDGRSAASTVVNAAVADMASRHPEGERIFAPTIEMMDTLIEEAIEDGDLGLIVLASAGAPGSPEVLGIPAPIRNDLRVGERPWLFELERLAYGTARPIVSIFTSRDRVDILRVVLGEVAGKADEERSYHGTRNVGGRHNVEGRASRGAGMHGGYGRGKVESSIEEHRAAAAREAAELVEQVTQPGDIIVLAGPAEPRYELLGALPDTLREGVREHEGDFGDERERLELSIHLAEEAQIEQADALAREVLSGAWGERIARGKTSIDRTLAEGRVDQLIVHEAAARHWGHATDARRVDPPWDDDAWYGDVLWRARETSAGVLFCREPAVLEEQEGAVATLRW